MKKEPVVFRPDYLPAKKIAYCGIGLVVFIVIGLLYASGGNIAILWNSEMESDEFLIIVGIFVALFLSVLACIINVAAKSWKNKDICYYVSDCGISVVYLKRVQRLIHWSEVVEIRVEHGPCEPDSEFEGGPYGVYVILEHIDKSLYSVRDRILNLTFSPKDLDLIQRMSVIRIYQNNSLKKCCQVQETISDLKTQAGF